MGVIRASTASAIATTNARVYDGRDRDDHDPRRGLIHDLDLPRCEERELVVGP